MTIPSVNTWPSWAVHGAKVICIESRENKLFYYDGPFPEVGKEYTIKDPCLAPSGNLSISLTELRWRDCDPGWPLACFRPAIAAKTLEQDVSYIRSLLDNMDTHSRLERLEELLNE